MRILDCLVALGLGTISFLLLFNRISQKQLRQQLDDAFYNLLKSKNGHISLIQLATVDAEFTRQYIEGQAKVFDATLEV